VAKQLNQGVTHLMKKNKVTVHMGVGDPQARHAGSDRRQGQGNPDRQAHHRRHGARARDLPFAKADGDKIWTYRHAMTPKEMPSKLLVIGSGAIGIEFASFYNDLGAKVTVVEMMDRIVPVEDGRFGLPRKGADQAGHEDPDRYGR
jgi:dihydrolipoamide dehydrogenase